MSGNQIKLFGDLCFYSTIIDQKILVLAKLSQGGLTEIIFGHHMINTKIYLRQNSFDKWHRGQLTS